MLIGILRQLPVTLYILSYFLLVQYFTDWCCRLTFAYAFWFVYDKDTSCRGGRPNRWVRRWKWFRRLAASRSMVLEKTADLDPRYSYLVGYHPHGAVPLGTLMFSTEAVDVSKVFPGISFHVLTLPLMHNVPLTRELMAALGMGQVDARSVDYVLQKPGHAALIVIGSMKEQLMTDPDKTYIFLKNRKGFVRRAIKQRAHLVPVFSFGETSVGKLRTQFFPWTKLNHWQRLYAWIFSYPPTIMSFIKHPFRKPIHAIGKPIFVEQDDNPTEELVNRIHAQYIDDLEKIYEDNKARFGVEPSNRLIFVD